MLFMILNHQVGWGGDLKFALALNVCLYQFIMAMLSINTRIANTAMMVDAKATQKSCVVLVIGFGSWLMLRKTATRCARLISTTGPGGIAVPVLKRCAFGNQMF
jgi:hypothetical protein